MKLKRYTTKELEPILTNIFLDEMSEGLVEKLHEEYVVKIQLYKEAIALYEQGLGNDSLDIQSRKSCEEQTRIMQEGLNYLTESNLSSQMRTYSKTDATDYSRTIANIPLNKKINSFYDDLILEVVFFDDVCTPKGYFDSYKIIDSKEEKIDFIQRNTVITHIGLVYEKNNRRIAMIQVSGDLNLQDKRVEALGINLLDKRFADFENLTLSRISTLTNNDLKQWFQTKIDLDKENMEELAHVFIRGDYYSIHRPKDTDDLYIRYVCRSTGRVYYNLLNLDNLKLSKEYIYNDYESYCKAWWNLCHLGTKVDGKPIIAC